MKNFIYSLGICACLFPGTRAFSQGCVAVKNMSVCPLNWDSAQLQTGWQFSMNYRYFRSYKHFRGTHEEKERVENGTEVINNDHSINLGITYTFNSRWTVTTIVPYIFIDRSSLYEHLGNSPTSNPDQQRFHTSSKGLGDIRLIAYYNPVPKFGNGSLRLGMGVKLPTGEYNYKDYFHKREGITLLPVDQSIQPGDGGLGWIAELDLNHVIKGRFYGYANAMYLVNPRNTNGTLRRPTPLYDIPRSNELSVADQYLLRAGGRYVDRNIQVLLGGRMECIPVRDLVGESDGFRRPGYIISLEPAFFFSQRRHTVGLSLPIALERNRTQSMLDKATTKATGEYQHGDAAFADWFVSLTYAYQLN